MTPDTFKPSITNQHLKDLRQELKQSLSEFGLTLKRAIDPHAKQPYSRQYISRLEHGQDVITQDIENAYWGITGVYDGMPAAVSGSVATTIYALPGQVPPNSFLPRTAKAVRCSRPGCPVLFIRTHPTQRYHDPDCQKAHERETRKKRVT